MTDFGLFAFLHCVGRLTNLDWVKLWLAKKIFYTVWGQIQPLEKLLTLLDF